jgi:AAA15 family ATPase/GTPase
MITQLSLTNFTVFRHIKIDFSPKINIIIGKNGTGKTHILKAAYVASSGSQLFKNKAKVNKQDIIHFLTQKLIRSFMPLDEKLGKMYHIGASGQAELEAQFYPEKNLRIVFYNNSESVTIQNYRQYKEQQKEPVFVPTKEVLSFMKGFNSLYERYELSFDQTYQDICLLLDLPEVRPESLADKSKWAMKEIENICGGKFIFYGGGKVNFKTKNSEYSANAIAEGFRKLGILSRLLETGAIQPGINGTLFWDEPEANLNPKLMGLLVQIILELSRMGQQFVISTHDYVLLKWFDLLVDKNFEDHILFHALYRDEETNEIKLESTENYLEISPNAISDAYNDLTKAQAKKNLGNLGR